TSPVKPHPRPLVLAALLLLAACSKKAEGPPPAPADAGPAQRAEVEPNDRPEQSMALGESTRVTASLTSSPAHADEDWYLLFSDTPRLAEVEVSGIPGTTLLLEVYDETRTRLLAVTGDAEGAGVRFPNLTVRGKLLLRISAARKGGGGAYTLDVRYRAPQPRGAQAGRGGGPEAPPRRCHRADAPGRRLEHPGADRAPGGRGPLQDRPRHRSRCRGGRRAVPARRGDHSPTGRADAPCG